MRTGAAGVAVTVKVKLPDERRAGERIAEMMLEGGADRAHDCEWLGNERLCLTGVMGDCRHARIQARRVSDQGCGARPVPGPREGWTPQPMMRLNRDRGSLPEKAHAGG